MNKKGYLLIGLIYSLFITNIMSQELKTPTLEDLIPGGRDLPLCRKSLQLTMVGG